ncbi:MAG: hypothetical protein CVV05_01030 [Gammaproteobacteria bacterium HGW-Gammaproteobacteria-1]|jgi:hypothetical protein|nr:MAG: hypothetical protein CVV05_01030 [Gammaproteobacteria bacterium HGW-Gammaproteobacteria-1]
MKDLLLPMMFDNGQSIHDGLEIGRLSARLRTVSQQAAAQAQATNNWKEAYHHAVAEATTYSELAALTEQQRTWAQDVVDAVIHDPHGLELWVQTNINQMRSRLVRAMISNERLLAMQAEEGITADERRRLNEHLVAFAYVLWEGVTRPMRLLDETKVKLMELKERLARNETVPADEMYSVLADATLNLGLAQSLRLASWPGIGWRPAPTKATLRERAELAQQELQRDMASGEVVFEEGGNRLVAVPGFTLYGINKMLDENWSWIMDKQFA